MLVCLKIRLFFFKSWDQSSIIIEYTSSHSLIVLPLLWRENMRQFTAAKFVEMLYICSYLRDKLSV